MDASNQQDYAVYDSDDFQSSGTISEHEGISSASIDFMAILTKDTEVEHNQRTKRKQHEVLHQDIYDSDDDLPERSSSRLASTHVSEQEDEDIPRARAAPGK